MCINCPPGYKCFNTSDPLSKKQCPAGQYATGKSDRCTVCQAGFYCPSTRLVGNVVLAKIGACKPFNIGYFMLL